MDLTVQINDDQFKGLFEDGIKTLTEEDKKQIIVHGFKQYLESDEIKDIIKQKLFTKTYYSNDYSLTPLAERLLSAAINEQAFKDISDYTVELLKSKGSEILAKALTNIIIAGVMKEDIVQQELVRSAEIAAQQLLWNHLETDRKNNGCS